MPDRRLILATLAAVLLIAGALIVPAGIDAAPQEALEPSSVTGPIASAIDAGVSDSLAGLLPTSEQHQRVSAVANGLKDGIPSSPPSLNPSQLADITSIASGAADGVLSSSPNTLTSALDKSALRALATGYLRGALQQISSSPTDGRKAIDDAASKGFFTAAAGLFVGEEPALTTDQFEQYGYQFAYGSFDELDKHGSAFSAIAGSPALADITLFTTTLVRGQLGSMPTGIARAQLDAVATFGAGALDGMVVGMVTQFPHGAPLPAREDLQVWFDALANGHEGTAPWRKPESLPLLLAWADGVAAGGVEGIGETRAQLGDSAPTPPQSQDELAAWADAVAQGGFERVDNIPSITSAIEADVRAYALAVTSPAVEHIGTVAGTPSDPELVAAWALGLTAGVEDVKGASAQALGLSEEWLEGLTGAVTTLPLDAAGPQGALLKQFAEGVTNQLTVRMDNITRAAISEEDAAFIGTMAEAIAEAAVGLTGEQALSNPELAEALGDGIASGFLETKNPQRLFDDIDALEGVIRAWVATGPPASLAEINALAQGGITRAYYATTEFGQVVGGAPVDWVAAHGAGLTPEFTGLAEDALWMATFASTYPGLILESIDPSNIDPTVQPIMGYASGVLARLPDAQLAIQNVTQEEGDFQQHAFAFASYLAGPAEWIALDPDAFTVEAALAAANATLDEADDVQRFTDATYVGATLAYIDAIALGLVPDKPGDPNGEYLPAWIQGILEAHEEMPVEEIEGDLFSRLDWVATLVTVVAPVGGDITAKQYEIARQYAKDSADWALSTPDHVPDMEGLDTPLLTWAEATVASALERLPPTPTDEEIEAINAYLEGISHAVTAVPDPTEYDWSYLPNQAAIEAYLAGVTSGIDRLDEELPAVLCAGTGKGCPEPEPTCGVEGKPECPPPEPAPPCADDIECLGEYTGDLMVWAESLAGAIENVPEADITPTREGIALVEAWAYLVLGGHGVCRADQDETDGCFATGECEDAPCLSPRGPIVDFLRAENETISAAAAAIGLGLTELLPWESDPTDPLPTDPENNPVLGWAAGLTSSIPEVYYDPSTLIPSSVGEGLVEKPPMGDPTDYEYRQLLSAWAQSLWEVPGKLRGEVFRPFPNTEGINATVADLDSFFAESIWQGGATAILDSADEVEQYGRGAVPDEALDAWALGLGQAAHDALVDPSKEDLQAMLFWYAGAAQGGVDAIIAAGDAATTRQVPALQAYAEVLAETYAPPAPPELDTVNGLFTPGGPQTPPPPSLEEGEEEEEEEEEEPEGPTWLEILQAYAAGMADAVLATPFQPTVTNVESYHNDVMFYLDGIVAAASAAPPASPDVGYPARLRAWVDAESTAATADPPTSAERASADPDIELALAYVQGFASTSPWNLEEELAGKEDWAQSAIEAGLATECPADLSAEACAAIGTVLGEAMGQALPQEAGEIPLPSEDDRLAFVQAILDAAAPELPDAPEGADAALVLGLVAGLAPAVGEPNLDEAAAATASAVGDALDQIPFVSLRPTVEEIAAYLADHQDPAQYAGLAAGAVALVVGMGDAANDPAVVEQRLGEFLAASGSGGASVSVTDGTTTISGDALDGTGVLDGLETLTFTAYPSASSAVQATWELRWSATDPNGASASRVAMSGSNGAYTATLAPAAIASLARGAAIKFVVVESTPGSASVHDRAGSAYAFVPDRDAPLASVQPGTLEGATLPVSWSATDGDSEVESYRVESRDGEGAWVVWLDATEDTSASFTGTAGHAYAFRVIATDVAGHASAAAESTRVAIPAGAPANHAPVVAFTAPVANAAFGKSIPVTLAASDPDGTQPTVRVCIRKESASVDLACPHDGKATGIAIETAAFADGRYRLHAIASDGTLTSEALSPLFTIDRAPPAIRGAAADTSPLAALLSISVDGATKVTVDVNGKTLELNDAGQGADARAGDGTWTVDAQLPAGEHLATFRAVDANGNEARVAKSLVVPALPPPDGAAPPTGTPTTPPTSQPPQAPPTNEPPGGGKGTPGASLVLVLAMLAAVAVALRRRRA